MSNLTKNLLLALSLVCAIVLIVFCIQLIVINRGVEPADSGSVISGGSGQEDGEDGDSDIGGEDVINSEDGITGAPLTPRPLPQGIRREILVTPDSWLVVYAGEELFTFEEGNRDWIFTYSAGGEATLEITFILITMQGVEAHAVAFLGDEAEFLGETSIADSLLRGYHVMAHQGTETVEAWIHTLEGSDLSLVFVINYENNEQKEALYEVLSTLEIVGASGFTPSDFTNPGEAALTDPEEGDFAEDYD